MFCVHYSDPDRDLEEQFIEAIKFSKARLKNIKYFATTVSALTQLTATHSKGLEKVATTSESAGNLFQKESGAGHGTFWYPLSDYLSLVGRFLS